MKFLGQLFYMLTCQHLNKQQTKSQQNNIFWLLFDLKTLLFWHVIVWLELRNMNIENSNYKMKNLINVSTCWRDWCEDALSNVSFLIHFVDGGFSINQTGRYTDEEDGCDHDDSLETQDEDTEEDKAVAAEGMWKYWSTYAYQLCSHLRIESANRPAWFLLHRPVSARSCDGLVSAQVHSDVITQQAEYHRQSQQTCLTRQSPNSTSSQIKLETKKL